MAHFNLGCCLRARGKLDSAVTAFRKARRLQPDYAPTHCSLGTVLVAQGKLGPAVAAYREAIRLQPDYALAHYNLGNVLRRQGKPEAATAAFRRAVHFQPGYPEAWCNLGQMLRRRGQFVEALKALRRGHQLGSRNPKWPYKSDLWVKDCERLLELDGRLPALRKGESKPAGAGECLELARLCTIKRLHGAAAKFYADAFTALPALATNLNASYRYRAACAAARAGCGRGKEAIPEKAREAARRQALDWLRADLAAWTQHLRTGTSQTQAVARQVLQKWQTEQAFTGLRDAKPLALLPRAEQKAWRRLWANVAALLPPARQKNNCLPVAHSRSQRSMDR
jgi:tetratricopeptide (TPR) repeat protein